MPPHQCLTLRKPRQVVCALANQRVRSALHRRFWDGWEQCQPKQINHFGSCSFVRQHTDIRVWWHKQSPFDKLDHCGESCQNGLLAPCSLPERTECRTYHQNRKHQKQKSEISCHCGDGDLDAKVGYRNSGDCTVATVAGADASRSRLRNHQSAPFLMLQSVDCKPISWAIACPSMG